MVIIIIHSFTGPSWVSSLWIGKVLQSWWPCESDARKVWGRHRLDCPCRRKRHCAIFRSYISRGKSVENFNKYLLAYLFFYKCNDFLRNKLVIGQRLNLRFSIPICKIKICLGSVMLGNYESRLWSTPLDLDIIYIKGLIQNDL